MKKVTKKAKSNNFIVYCGNDETLVTTEAMEKKMLKEYMFAEEPKDKAERYISEYDRYVISVKELAVMLSVKSGIRVDNGMPETQMYGGK